MPALEMLRWDRKPVSVLSRHLSSQPTPWKRAGSPFALADVPVYLVLQAPVPSPSYVATRRREPLPHGFTLALAGGLFSVTASIRLLPSVLSTAGCPFLSGLSSEQAQRKLFTPSRFRDSPEGHSVFTLFRPATFYPFVFFKDTDPVATAKQS